MAQVELELDGGHGGKDPGAVGPTGLKEAAVTLALVKKVGAILTTQGIAIGYTRVDDRYVDLGDRCAIANKAKARAFISIHINSAVTPKATGTETHAYSKGGSGDKLAQAIQKRLQPATGLADRGVKYSNFAVLRETAMPAALIEVCFISNPKEEALLKQEAFLDKVAMAVALGYLDYTGRTYKAPGKVAPKPEPKPESNKATPPVAPNGTPILAATTITVGQAQAWAKLKGATSTFIDLARIYWGFAAARGGVNPALAYCQAAKETGFGKFGGVIDATFNNPCGMKTATGGGDMDPAAHMRFKSWDDGVKAHLDHLALYAGSPGYPRKDTTDPRHFIYVTGKATTVEALSEAWAPSTTYGQEIKALMDDLKAVKEGTQAIDQATTDLQQLKATIAKLTTEAADAKALAEKYKAQAEALKKQLESAGADPAKLEQLKKDLENATSRAVVAERAVADLKAQLAKVDQLKKTIKELIGGM